MRCSEEHFGGVASERYSMQKLTAKPELCTGCLNCQTVCALLRSGRQDKSAAAIRVNLHLFSGNNTLVFCRQCEKPDCLKACPVSAIERNPGSGAWNINENICLKCGKCVSACSYGAMLPGSPGTIPVKCDLCGGSPSCVEACVFNALTFEGSL
jgi:Fe-S-cluster-containing hydrogenase component 2